jgi:hypothetical protein
LAVKFAPVFIAVAVPISIGLAGSAQATSDQQIKFMADVNQHGGLTTSQVFTVKDGNGTTLGDAVCGDLHKGEAAANSVIGVSNIMHMPMSQAEVVVYWAITDLCPDEMSQRQDHWRDGQ